MKMSGSEFIDAPRQQVWDALNDAEILKKSITGCKSLEKQSDTAFNATVQAKVGPVKATFNGDVKLSKLNPPESYVLSGQGKGGVAGFAKGKASVKLEEEGSGTRLSYDVDAQVGGKLAQIGSRLIDSTAKKMAADFFKKFAKLAAQTSEQETTEKPPAKRGAKKPAKKAAKKPAKKAAAKKPVKKPVTKPAAETTGSKTQAAAPTQLKQKPVAASAPASSASANKAKSEPVNETGNSTVDAITFGVLFAVGLGILALYYFLFA